MAHRHPEDSGTDIARAISDLDPGPEPPLRDMVPAAMRQGAGLRRHRRWTVAVTAVATACVAAGVVSQSLPAPRVQPPATRPVVRDLSAADLAKLIPPSWGSVSEGPLDERTRGTDRYSSSPQEEGTERSVTIRRPKGTDLALSVTVSRVAGTRLPLFTTVDQQGDCGPLPGRHTTTGPWGKKFGLCRAPFPAAGGARAYELFDEQHTHAVGVIHLSASGWAVQVVTRPLRVAAGDSTPLMPARNLYSLAADPRLLRLAVAAH